MSPEGIEQQCLSAINLLTTGHASEAIIAFTDILRKDEKLALAWNNRGLGLLHLGHPFDAILNIDKAITLEPNAAEYHNNKGAALFEQEDADTALQAFSKAVELRPNFHEALMNRGNVLKYKGRLAEALDSYRASIQSKPDYADGHLHLAFAALMAGLYEEGWKEFEWRWKVGQMPERGLPYPAWTGEDLKGKTLIIYGEQGFGDVLQFIRYAPLVKAKFGGKILVEVRQPLARLVNTVEGIDGIVVFGEKMPEGIDYAVAMMSLPHIMGTTIETIPWSGPYFKADEYRMTLWQERLKLLPPGPLIGVCWAGMSRPGNPAASSVDKKRSTTLNSFAPLAKIPGISWVSLQKGPPSSQVETPPRGMTIGDWTSEIDDFYDTAALIESLDMVISVDTAVVHLAAALGKPTWLLSRWDGCWRWLGHRSDSPWYPTLRQFAQHKPGDWDTLMQEAAGELEKIVPQQKAA
jgi:hypothetical protein